MADETTPRQDLERRASALLELEARRKGFPLYFFRPVPKAEAFYDSSATLKILSGGNRSGKTEQGCAEDISCAIGYRPWVLKRLGLPQPEKPWIRPEGLPPEALVFTGAGVRIQVPNKGVIVSGLSMRQGIGQTVAPKLRQLLGPCLESEHITHAGTPGDFRLKNGSIINFSSDEQPSLAFESFDVDWWHMDEPCRRRVYVGLKRASVDRFARGHMTFTPLGANSSWIFKDLYSKADGKNIAAFNLSIYDNPYLPREAIAEFANDPAISEVEKEARLYGRFQHLVDRIYPAFSDEVHVVSPFQIPDDWYFGMVVDPHSARPFAIAYFTISPGGDIFIYNEWPHEDFTKIRKDSRDAKAYSLLMRELDDGKQIYIRLMDPNAGPRKDVTRGTYVESWVDLFSPYGLMFNTNLNDRLDYGEGCVRRLLAYDPSRAVNASNRPKLYVFDTCINTIAALSYYTVATKAGTDAEIKEGERDPTYKDFSDLVRYIAVSQAATAALSDCPLGSSMFESYFNDTEDASYV